MTSLIERLRAEAVADLFNLKGFHELWHARRQLLCAGINANPKKADIRQIADRLSPTFRVQAGTGRSQAGVSRAGTHWEALVVWYLNLNLVGTKAVCLRASLSPGPIRDALSVCFQSAVLRSETDVVVISSEGLATTDAPAKRKDVLERCNEILEETFDDTGLVNIQCKTNWNDNAQIPMLWNMLYNQARKGVEITDGFSIGRNGYSLKNLGAFGYAFATVPTQGKGPKGYKAKGLDVMRVKTMTAGNYWGYPTISGICFSLGEFFNQFNKSSAVFPNIADVGKAAALAFTNQSLDAPPMAPFRLKGFRAATAEKPSSGRTGVQILG